MTGRYVPAVYTCLHANIWERCCSNVVLFLKRSTWINKCLLATADKSGETTGLWCWDFRFTLVLPTGDSGEHCDLRQPEPTSDLRCWKVANNPKQAWLPSITGTSWHTQTHSAENALLSGWKGHFGIFFWIIKQTCTHVRRLSGLHSASDRLRLLSWGSWTLSGKDLLLQRKINPIFKLQTQPLTKANETPSVILSSWSTLHSNGTEKLEEPTKTFLG